MRSRCLRESGENLPPFAHFAVGSAAKTVPAGGGIAIHRLETHPPGCKLSSGIGRCWQGRRVAPTTCVPAIYREGCSICGHPSLVAFNPSCHPRLIVEKASCPRRLPVYSLSG